MRRSRAKFGALPLTALAPALAAAIIPSCGGGGGGGGGAGDTFDREALLANLAANLVLPVYEDFVAKAQALKTAADAYAADVADPDLRAAARQAWKDAMDVWQRAELLQFGPAGKSTEVVAGMNLRDYIYSWPTTSPCDIDREVVAGEFNDADFFQTRLVNVYGLDALEYLLFRADTGNACGSGVPPNSDGAWGALTAEEIEQRRAEYAAACAGNVLARAQQLLDEWAPSGNDFAGKFSNAGTSGVYSSAHAAVNDVFAGMFYLDTMVKDKKIGAPAGISGGTVDPSRVESPTAATSKEHLLRNLETFQFMFLGNRPGDPPGVGFDDFLTARGAPALAAEMETDIAEAIAAVQAIPGTLQDALVSDLSSVQAAHAAIKDITDHLKSQFVTVLNLSVPNTGAGDND
ncbi:MAG TPA: imelysin family protein [Planctomycetota bacterium]|nr:imelysin family protein [Planctomycetota bacterium]